MKAGTKRKEMQIWEIKREAKLSEFDCLLSGWDNRNILDDF
jgi:hypothetical protein